MYLRSGADESINDHVIKKRVIGVPKLPAHRYSL
jgi:hypothetical protein